MSKAGMKLIASAMKLMPAAPWGGRWTVSTFAVKGNRHGYTVALRLPNGAEAIVAEGTAVRVVSMLADQNAQREYVEDRAERLDSRLREAEEELRSAKQDREEHIAASEALRDLWRVS